MEASGIHDGSREDRLTLRVDLDAASCWLAANRGGVKQRDDPAIVAELGQRSHQRFGLD